VAVAIAERHRIDLGKIRRRSEREGAAEKFERFRSELKKTGRR